MRFSGKCHVSAMEAQILYCASRARYAVSVRDAELFVSELQRRAAETTRVRIPVVCITREVYRARANKNVQSRDDENVNFESEHRPLSFGITRRERERGLGYRICSRSTVRILYSALSFTRDKLNGEKKRREKKKNRRETSTSKRIRRVSPP